MIKIELERTTGDYGFTAKNENGNTMNLDSSTDMGGSNSGVRPMQTLLMALGACSGIDIVSILKKQRQVIQHFNIKIEGEREKDQAPSLWKQVHVGFELDGTIDEEKATRACALSIEKYCSVAETLRRAGAQISWNLTINNHESCIP